MGIQLNEIMKIKTKILRCNTDKTTNGTIYPKDVMAKAIDKYKDRLQKVER